MPRVVYERRRRGAGDALDLADEQDVVAGLVVAAAPALEDGTYSAAKAIATSGAFAGADPASSDPTWMPLLSGLSELM